MIKKIAASILALAMVFGMGAASAARSLPDTAIAASAQTFAFEIGDYKYSYDNIADTVKITAYTGSDAVVTIPSKIEEGEYKGKRIAAVGAAAFKDNQTITKVTIPNGVTLIGDSAFHQCRNLKTVEIPDSVNTIELWAFAGCHSLESIHIPYGVKEIPVLAFDGCKSLTSVSIPDSVTKVGYRAFQNCEKLAKVTLSQKLETIGELAFVGCNSMKSITVPASVKEIGIGALGYESYETVKVNTKIPTFFINGYSGTAAYDYAMKNGFIFAHLAYASGDVNGDGMVDSADVIKVAAYVKGLGTLTAEEQVRADVSCDSKIDSDDVVRIATYVKGAAATI